jgi:hypothetical protein
MTAKRSLAALALCAVLAAPLSAADSGVVEIGAIFAVTGPNANLGTTAAGMAAFEMLTVENGRFVPLR